MAVTLAIAAAVPAGPASAGYDGPGFQTCQSYAQNSLPRHYSMTFVNDQETIIERYTRNVGSQFVSSVLTGKAVWRLSGSADGAVSYRQMRYICLLADESNAVFFHWQNDPSAPRQ